MQGNFPIIYQYIKDEVVSLYDTYLYVYTLYAQKIFYDLEVAHNFQPFASVQRVLFLITHPTTKCKMLIVACTVVCRMYLRLTKLLFIFQTKATSKY